MSDKYVHEKNFCQYWLLFFYIHVFLSSISRLLSTLTYLYRYQSDWVWKSFPYLGILSFESSFLFCVFFLTFFSWFFTFFSFFFFFLIYSDSSVSSSLTLAPDRPWVCLGGLLPFLTIPTWLCHLWVFFFCMQLICLVNVCLHWFFGISNWVPPTSRSAATFFLK